MRISRGRDAIHGRRARGEFGEARSAILGGRTFKKGPYMDNKIEAHAAWLGRTRAGNSGGAALVLTGTGGRCALEKGAS